MIDNSDKELKNKLKSKIDLHEYMTKRRELFIFIRFNTSFH